MKHKQMSLPILGLALLAAAVCAAAPFQDGPPTVLTSSGRLGNGGFAVLQPPATPLAGLVSPKALTGKLTMAGKSVLLAIDARQPAGELAVLRFDLAGKGDFLAATVVELQAPKGKAGAARTFHYQAKLPGPGGHPLYLQGDLSPATMMAKTKGAPNLEIFLVNQLCVGIRSGTVAIGGASHSVALIDMDGNAVFNDAAEVKNPGRRGDVVLVDAGKGDFSNPAQIKTVVLNHLFEQDGKYYEFRPDPQGKTLDVQPAKVAFGKLRLDAGGMTASGQLAGSLTDVAMTSTGEKTVPADKYRISSLQVRDPASKAMLLLGALPLIEVKPGQTLVVPVDSTLKCRIAATPMNGKREVTLSAKLATGSGQPASRVYDQAGKTALIALEILDAQGKKIHQGNFQYGWGGTCSHTWRVPEGVAGKFTVVPVLTVPPFKVELQKTEIEIK